MPVDLLNPAHNHFLQKPNEDGCQLDWLEKDSHYHFTDIFVKVFGVELFCRSSPCRSLRR